MRAVKTPGYVFGTIVLLVLFVAAVILAVLLMVGGGDDNPDKTVLSPVPSAKADPSELIVEKAVIERRVKAFVAAYYTRNASLYVNGLDGAQSAYEARLELYVTKSFLESYTPFLSTEAFVSEFEKGAGLKASIVPGSVIDHRDGGTIEQTLSVRIVPYDTQRSYASRTITIDIVLVNERGVWRVASLDEVAV